MNCLDRGDEKYDKARLAKQLWAFRVVTVFLAAGALYLNITRSLADHAEHSA